MAQPETFTVLFSIRAFLIDILQQEMSGLRVFLNPMLLPHEEEEITSLDHYLHIEITEGEINWEQPFDVSFRLWAKKSFDSTLTWLQKAPYKIIQACMNTKTDTDINMIALLDFDSLIGESAIQDFYTDGTLPPTLLATVQKRYPDVPYHMEGTMRVGLKALPSDYAPKFDFETIPMSATWVMTFKYFEPLHQKAVRL